jgi:hypothetical protein
MLVDVIQDIEDAIIKSGLGFTPNNDGNIIRINVPQLTEERRKQMVKLANSEAENAKVPLRLALQLHSIPVHLHLAAAGCDMHNMSLLSARHTSTGSRKHAQNYC